MNTTSECPQLPCGQRCLYTVSDSSDSAVSGHHATPVARYIDDIEFTMSAAEDGRCSVVGESRSSVWYAVLDMGTNYCNLWNLLDGTGLNRAEGFTEVTSDAVCTQYSSRDCDRF